MKTFELTVNGKDVSGALSDEEKSLFEAAMLIDNPLSGTFQTCLDRKVVPVNAAQDAPAIPLRDFYLAQFSAEGKNPEDSFTVKITDGEDVYEATASRGVIGNRLFVATNREAYQTTIVKNVTKKSAATKAAPAVKRTADL